MADSKKYDGSQWEHSLRKMTTATADIEPTIYTDGTAITAYTIKGNTVQNGTPTPSNPVDVQGVGNKTANLLNEIVQGGVRATDGNLSSSSNRVRTNYISVTGGETYTVSCDTLLVAVICAYNNSVYDSTLSQLSASSQTVTIPQGANQIAISFMKTNGADVTPAEAGQIMLNVGSTPLPYEPHGYKIPISSNGVSYPIYLSEPLRKVGDYADTINSNGTVTRNIATLTFNGTETWIMGTERASSNVTDDGTIIPSMSNQNVICTNFASPSGIYIGQSGARLKINVSALPSGVSTADELKTWFATQYNNNTPVIMWYIRATPTTETVTAPTIPTTEGVNSISVDTTVQPSEFTATWTGWHDSSVKEYDGSDWQ